MAVRRNVGRRSRHRGDLQQARQVKTDKPGCILGLVISSHNSRIDSKRSISTTTCPHEGFRVSVLDRDIDVSSGSVPINYFNAIPLVDVAKAVHQRLHPPYSLQKVLATNIALRARVENTLGRSMRHDDVDVLRNRVRSNGDGARCNLLRCIETVFVMRV